MILKIKKTNPEAIIPNYAHETDAGLDLYSTADLVLKPNTPTQIPIGIAIELPNSEYVALVWDKSGLSHKSGLKTLGGVIDSGFRGEIQVGMINLTNKDVQITKGQKIAQLLIQNVLRPKIEEVKELAYSDRGEKAFGSTGV